MKWCHSDHLNFYSWEEAFWFILSNKENFHFIINLIIFSQYVIIVVLLLLTGHISQSGPILFSDVVLVDNIFSSMLTWKILQKG